MLIDSYPIIKLEIDEMKQTILHHFNSYQDELSNLVEKEIEQALQNYDFESKVRVAVADAINKTIASYFEYGEGRKTISASVEKVLGNIFDPSNDIELPFKSLPTLKLEDLEKTAIINALHHSKGNQGQAAEMLGISSRKINYLIHHVYKIDDFVWRKNKKEIKDEL